MRAAYLELAQREPARIQVIDAAVPLDGGRAAGRGGAGAAAAARERRWGSMTPGVARAVSPRSLRGAYAAGTAAACAAHPRGAGRRGRWPRWAARWSSAELPRALRALRRLPAAGRDSIRTSPRGPIEDSTQIRIEQVRELAAELALTLTRAATKSASVPRRQPESLRRQCAAEDARGAAPGHAADSGRHAALAPAGHHPQPLPAGADTRAGASRGVAWLEAARGPGDWEEVLAVLGRAPLATAEADPAAVAEIAAEVRRGPRGSPGGGGRPRGHGRALGALGATAAPQMR